MANVAVTYSFSSATKAKSGEVNTDLSDITTWLNNRNGGSDTWGYMKVSATASNPVEVKSSAASAELDIDCTGTNGTPVLTWRRSGTTYFTAGVDGAASNAFKLGTTALTTNVAIQIASTGTQVQFCVGSNAASGITYIGDLDTGFNWDASNTHSANAGGTRVMSWKSTETITFLQIRPQLDNDHSVGLSSNRYTAIWAVNGAIQTSHSSTKTNVETLPDEKIILPEAVTFNRPTDTHNKPQLGFLADGLPEECFAVREDGTRSREDVYTSAVIGLLAAAIKKIDQRVKTIESNA